MTKSISSFELVLGERPALTTLTRWLYQELRQAILDRRLQPNTRLPATRDFAIQYSVSRGTVVTAFQQLQSEGYLVGRVGAGTRVNEHLPKDLLGKARSRPAIKRVPQVIRRFLPRRLAGPFRAYEPALNDFPTQVWARISGRRARRASVSLLAGGDPRGYGPLREAVAAYLGSSRGVNCSADSVVIVSGVQQGLDLISRLLLKPGDPIWVEDPGYFGALAAFRQAGARIIPVPVDECGLVVSEAKQACARAKAAYVTPAHQFPLGVTMSLERRLALLSWARGCGAFLMEDDYDSEYRFEGRTVPALQGLDKSGSVVFLGSFNKVLFPSLRIGYVVLPTALIDSFLRMRMAVDFFPPGLDQAILCDFIVEGHLGRHIRHMRELYATRLDALQNAAREYLSGLLKISPIAAGLNTSAFLQNGMTSRRAEALAAAHEIEVLGLHRFSLTQHRWQGLLLGFAAFDGQEIRRGVRALAAALGSRSSARPVDRQPKAAEVSPNPAAHDR